MSGTDKPPVILILEDDWEMLELYHQLLSPHWEVRMRDLQRDFPLAELVRDVLDADLIISDGSMAKLRLDHVQAACRKAGKSLLIVSAHSLAALNVREEDRTRNGVELNFEYLPKPFRSQDLLSRVKEFLAKQGREGTLPVSAPPRSLESESTEVPVPPPSILIVEDEPEISHSLQAALASRFLGVAPLVTWAGDAESAAALLKDQKFDLIVTDLMMPGMDGLELFAEIRRRGLDSPVILMSAFYTEARKIQAQNLGIDFLLEKPFRHQQFLDAVQAALKKHREK